MTSSQMNAPPLVLAIGVVGFGMVGQELVRQIFDSRAKVERDLGVRLEVVAVAKSKDMLLLGRKGAGQTANQLLQGAASSWPPHGAEPADLAKFAAHLSAKTMTWDRALIVDSTAADAPAELYADWLRAGLDVVTPNKKAGSGPLDRYRQIAAAQREGPAARFLAEATVGAGLPVIRVAQDLRNTADEVEKVEGIFSGTLSYIFNEWKPGVRFSEVVAVAKDKGFTEPDPRDDLSGTDVARKVTILAREFGLDLELKDVPVESLVPARLESWTGPEDGRKDLATAFVEELESLDAEMAELLRDAEAAGEVLRYVGSVDVKMKKASVKLGRFPKTHPFASTQFADNIVAFHTRRYTPRPLVVQGPGAGAAVTAAGVLGDVLSVAAGMAQQQASRCRDSEAAAAPTLTKTPAANGGATSCFGFIPQCKRRKRVASPGPHTEKEEPEQKSARTNSWEPAREDKLESRAPAVDKLLGA